MSVVRNCLVIIRIIWICIRIIRVLGTSPAFKITTLPCLYKLSPCKWVHNILRSRLARIVIFTRFCIQVIFARLLFHLWAMKQAAFFVYWASLVLSRNFYIIIRHIGAYKIAFKLFPAMALRV